MHNISYNYMPPLFFLWGEGGLSAHHPFFFPIYLPSPSTAVSGQINKLTNCEIAAPQSNGNPN